MSNFILTVFYLLALNGLCEAVKFRRDLKVFMRYNVKVNMFPPNTIFAYADGFRLNWDIAPKKQGRSLGTDDYRQNGLPADYGMDESAETENLSRTSVVSSVESLLTRHGMNGTACLERARCEARLMGVPHDILTHLYLELFGPDSNQPIDETCKRNTPLCSVSLLHWITSLDKYAEYF